MTGIAAGRPPWRIQDTASLNLTKTTQAGIRLNAQKMPKYGVSKSGATEWVMGTTERVKVGINAQFDTYREVEEAWSIKPGSFRAYTMASARLRTFILS